MELKPKSRQVLYIVSSLLNVFCLGLMYGYPALLIPYLKNKSSDIQADLDIISWIGAIPGLSSFITNILIGPLMNSLGRKYTHLLVTTCGLIGWILAASSYSISSLLLARALHGITKGSLNFFGVCIAEFSSPHLRGVSLNMKVMCTSLGIAAAHVIGFFIHWRNLAIVGIVASSIALVMNMFWTETPEWYIKRKDFDKAEITFYQLRDRNNDSEEEIKKMIEAKQEAPQTVRTFKVLVSKQFWIIALLVTSKQLVMEFGGRHYFPAYMIEIVTGITGDKSNSFIYVIILDFICIVANTLSCYLVKRFPRRKLLIYPGCVTVFTLLSLCLALFLQENYFQTNVLLFTIALFFSLYFFIVNSTVFSACYVVANEIWPLEFRHIGVVYHSLINSIIFTLWMKVVPILTQSIHLYGMLAICAGILSINLLHFYKYLPETRNKTLHDIGEIFKDKGLQVRDPDLDKESQKFLRE